MIQSIAYHLNSYFIHSEVSDSEMFSMIRVHHSLELTYEYILEK